MVDAKGKSYDDSFTWKLLRWEGGSTFSVHHPSGRFLWDASLLMRAQESNKSFQQRNSFARLTFFSAVKQPLCELTKNDPPELLWTFCFASPSIFVFSRKTFLLSSLMGKARKDLLTLNNNEPFFALTETESPLFFWVAELFSGWIWLGHDAPFTVTRGSASLAGLSQSSASQQWKFELGRFESAWKWEAHEMFSCIYKFTFTSTATRSRDRPAKERSKLLRISRFTLIWIQRMFSFLLRCQWGKSPELSDVNIKATSTSVLPCLVIRSRSASAFCASSPFGWELKWSESREPDRFSHSGANRRPPPRLPSRML